MTSRSKFKPQTELCGDCEASDPSWASINRGILLCSDCCSVHRSLGRHVSIVKSLRQGQWSQSVLNFVKNLSQNANSIWEHSLLETTNNKNIRRKPTPKDPLHPNKSDFIKAKHCNLQFVLKPNVHYDNTPNGENELSKQLHASVRSGILETSLRLLVQGADPNYFHEEKRSTPLHVAAKFGQTSQIELLIVYGASINVVDGNGQTPIEIAKNNDHNAIAERLIEAMYEVTDRIIVFLGGKKPDHASGKHLSIPERKNLEISEHLKIARGKLQLVPNKMFEELVMDLYDEVDRRENEAIWVTSSLNPDSGAVPFLPANPFLSATRNQGRQKLARFSPIQFSGLLTDVLLDARRRQNMANLRPVNALPRKLRVDGASNSNLSDDEPLYDDVADDDYAALTPLIHHETLHTNNVPPLNATSSALVEDLRKQLIYYMSEVNELKSVVHQLSAENTHLKLKFSESPQNDSFTNIYDVPLRIDVNEKDNDQMDDGSSSSQGNSQSTAKRPASMYETRPANVIKNPVESCRTATSMYQIGGGEKKANEVPVNFAEDVRSRIDVITKRLKELCVAMQDIQNQNNTFVPCAERIKVAVGDLISLFPLDNCNETISVAIKQLNVYTSLMQKECENLAKSIQTSDNPAIEAFIQEVRDCALHLASATKTLVIQFQ
ncbi:ARF GTPase-activating protein Git-like [Condylostylus longicornis]|uniref:ARF GTPase-activating protein Git-like n=1 Tax=Condylostylus longicornis TaxID=2530218 RepID=UPI00244E1ECB|nr:ARF GTPase-activating protein Git-like [Condylostylus longicornis]